jgi:acylphosphatase
VWYRASTQQQAQSLGLSGYAKNLADGRVEVVACGSESSVEALCQWLWHGPRHAEVTAVECETVALHQGAGFETL